jgi:hypothetical protein
MRTHWLSALLLTVLCSLGLVGCDDSGGNSKTASIRVLNVSPGYESLDIYVKNENEDDTDALVLQDVAYETVSEYAEVDSGTYTIRFRRSGVSGNLRSVSSQNLTDDSHITYVGYGSTNNFAVVAITEDDDEPDAGDTLVKVFSAAEGVGTLDVYFTDSSVSLDNVSADFSSVGSGSGTIDSGTYRLRVTGAGDPDDIRLDIPEITLESRQIVALIFTGTPGGTLVNAVMLPQRGELTLFRNTQARVRGAVGISRNTRLTARVGDATLFSNATAGAIGSRYTRVEAGTLPVELVVDGTQVAAPSRTLEAGADYTLLVWDDDAGTHTTLISDDNRLPNTSGTAKLRLLNGMSGIGEPINLAIDYSPIAEGVELGQASAFVNVDSGTGFQMDVTNTNTSLSLLRRDDVTLQASSVYTMFMAGGPNSDQIVGTLRKDR